MNHIELECEECGATHKIDVSDFSFKAVDSDARHMGPEITYEGSVELDCDCGLHIEVTHRYWEYEGDENHKETEAPGARVLKNSL